VIGGIIGSVPTAAPPPPPPPVKKEEVKQAAPQRIRVGGNVQQAMLVRQPKPVYPPLAKQARISGVVRLNAIISKDGTIQNLSVLSGHPLLVPAAMEAVKQWVYKPTLLNGEAVEVVTQVDVNFTLSQ
jgi:protein TonB